MKLEKIKLAGFKSFADQTTIAINGNLTAIVGPNGCGKSNVIDAVRWVMGENSAKHLRGDNMADVIFNGSASRKPVSIATVELIFDNSEGKIGGEYSKYQQISIKKQVSREGQSQYTLNNSKCRRKDITDLFLGTGLGAKSYAIIEQGTISKLVESKPDELRMYVEEAAGISKYKERRYETETRMRHTRENLERLDDLCEEVNKQLLNLKKQAKQAKKFTELKKQERQYKRELLTIRWNHYQQISQQLETRLQATANEHNRLFVLARKTNQIIETQRSAHKNQQQHLDEEQANYYQLTSEVSNLQQTIKHNESNHQETIIEIARLKQQVDFSNKECQIEQKQLKEIQANLLKAEKKHRSVKVQIEKYFLAQQQLQQQNNSWQKQWNTHLSENSQYKEQAEIQKIKLSHLSKQSQQLQQRLDKLKQEQNELSQSDLPSEITSLNSRITNIETDRETLQQQLKLISQQILNQRQTLKSFHELLHQNRSELHKINGKLTSLELLQQHAMGKDKKDLIPWLEKMNLAHHQHLIEFITVDIAWEKAVETVLGSYFEAICLADSQKIMQELQSLTNQSITLFETNKPKQTKQNNSPADKLLDKITSPWDLTGLLTGIYCVDDLKSAHALSTKIKPYESIITKKGEWLGCGWIKILGSRDSKIGVLQREKELRDLKQQQQDLQFEIETTEKQTLATEQALKELETNREGLQSKDKILVTEFSAKNAQLSAHSARQEQQQQRLNQINHDIKEINVETADIAKMMLEAKNLQQIATDNLAQSMSNKSGLDIESQTLATQQSSVEMDISETQKKIHDLSVQIESLKTSEELRSKQIKRCQTQHQQATERTEELENKLDSTLSPLGDEKTQLKTLTEKKALLAEKLKENRNLQQQTETEIAGLTEQYNRTQQAMEQQKEQLDTVRFEQQDSQVRQQTITEQLNEIEADPEQISLNLSADAEESVWKNKIDTLTKKIERLGSINLTAIEEYKTQSERMNFLNEQHNDLVEALHTLNQAINKIDKESTLRFKQTFDKINHGLQTKFPKLFGGGQAHLELTEENLLVAGVNIIARPPGKRNSTIHLLSGGEKALTAIALVFSIFDLNPAPFCLLDEVDAPLDDANIVRFSKMVEEMSETVQFLYISHNKITMEIAKQLTGVTMKESGVSRMVSVDIEVAVAMAES